MFFSYLLAFTVSGAKSAILIFVSLYILWLSLLSDSLYIIDFKQFDSDMHWFCFLHIHCGWDSLNFLDLGAHNFHQIWNIFGYYVFKGFFQGPLLSAHSETQIMSILGCLTWSDNLLILCSFFYFILSSHGVSFWILNFAVSSHLPADSSEKLDICQ